MLIIYRTNAGFEGQLVSLDRAASVGAMVAYLANATPRPELAYLEIDERLLDAELLTALSVEQATFLVVDGVLTRDGVPCELGYTPGITQAATAALYADPVVNQLFNASEADLRTWLALQSTADVFVLIRDVLRQMAAAVGLIRISG